MSTLNNHNVAKIETQGDIVCDYGQLGETINKTSGANLTQIPTTDFSKYYYRYIINATASINFDLAAISTQVNQGYACFIRNTGTAKITVRNGAAATVVGIAPGFMAKIIARGTGGANDWIIGCLCSVTSASGSGAHVSYFAPSNEQALANNGGNSIDWQQGNKAFSSTGTLNNYAMVPYRGPSSGSYLFTMLLSNTHSSAQTVVVYEYTVSQLNNVTQPQAGNSIGSVSAAAGYSYTDITLTPTATDTIWVFQNSTNSANLYIRAMIPT